MRAVHYPAFRTPPEVREVADPVAPEGGVVVRVGATGVCRSDWHGWMGHDPDIVPPHVPGHEWAGTIVEVGSGVTSWSVGDRVTAPFVCGCGACAECRAGHPQVCEYQFQPGFTHFGSFAEAVAIHHAEPNLVRLPKSMSFEAAAALGCRFGTAFRAVVDQGRVAPGEQVVVHGCGGVGLSAVRIAAAFGARVTAVDVDDARLALARSLGAEALVNARGTPNVAEAVRQVTAGGAHLSVDALGSAPTCMASVLGLRRRGRHVQVGLLTGDERNPPLPMDRVVAHELEILGSHGVAAARYPEILSFLDAHGIDPSEMIGMRIGLKDLPDALVHMDEFRGVGITVAVLQAP